MLRWPKESRSMPLAAIAFEKRIGLFRSPTAGRILRNRCGFGSAPDIENRLNERPCGLDAVTTIEQSGIAAQAIIDEGSVRASRRIAKSFAIAEIHGDIADAHFSARAFGAEGDGNSFVGLDVEDQSIGFGFAAAEDNVGRAFELNDDFGGAFGEAFAGAEIERNISPAPVVDQKFCSNKSLGTRFGIDVLFFAIAGNDLSGEGAGRILAADNGLRDHFEVEGTNGLKDFWFFVADGSDIERSGRLNSGERCELEDVALNHVAQGTGSLIKAAAAFHAESFGCGDLNVVDVVAIPEWFKDAVSEAKNEKILNCIFSEI